MKPLFEMNKTDQLFYEQKIRPVLPKKVLDVHTHVWLSSMSRSNGRQKSRTVKWPSLVARQNSIEELYETYRLMFPDQQVTPVIFGSPKREWDTHWSNRYIESCAKKYGCPSFLLIEPSWSGQFVKENILRGGHVGVKVYLNYAPESIEEPEIRIFDFLPHHQLSMLDSMHMMVMLHIPRKDRLKDPENIAQLLQIEEQYPNVRLIVAHVGRAYCASDVGDAFLRLAETERMVFDISANTNATVFDQLIRAVGPKRILFGSDMPILRMRSKRICENGVYINLVPKGLYGDVSSDAHMREVESPTSDAFTFFMYEEIAAFAKAAEKNGLTTQDMEDVFYNNAKKWIDEVKGACYE